MPHSHPYEQMGGGTQQSSLVVGDELYNLTQLAEVSIVYFEHHAAVVVEDSKKEAFNKASTYLFCFVSFPPSPEKRVRAGAFRFLSANDDRF